jgi:hypothetical protein
LQVTLTAEGAHLAELIHKDSGVNPLWTPHWPSIEPSSYRPSEHPEYGGDIEAQLLSGILGHNICLDTFGAPSPEELAAGMPVHGEAPVAAYQISGNGQTVVLTATLDKAQMRFQRKVSLLPGSTVVELDEAVENLSSSDRPIAWTQHVTLGAPFLEPGSTQFRASATRSKVIDASFNGGQGMQQPGAEFEWPFCPRKDQGSFDLRTFPAESVSGGFTAHLMDPEQPHAWFLAWSPTSKVAIVYVWQRADFPWLARWEENHLRTLAPWNGQGLACGMEFGVSPMVESRRQMVERGHLFGAPTFRWLPARATVAVSYRAFITTADSAPEAVSWDGVNGIRLI